MLPYNNRKGSRSGVSLTCPCGKEFYCLPSRAHRTRCCSKKCQYEYARRPSGLNYEIKVENPTWFKKGEKEPHSHKFPKGWISPWVIKPGQRISPATEFKKGQIPRNYKGDAVGYHALHMWVRRHFGCPTRCEHCSSVVNLCWASKDWTYSRERSAWMTLCQKCHSKYDRKHAWGVASKIYPEIQQK